MPIYIQRRQMLAAGAGLLLATDWAEAGPRKNKKPAAPRMTLGFTTYGMRQLKLEQALKALSKIGFDSVEIESGVGQPSDAAKIAPKRRQAIRKLLNSTGLHLPSLMEHLRPSGDKQGLRKNLDRLKLVAQYANDLAPNEPPLIQTVLGGGKWSQLKNLFVDRMGQWIEVTGKANVVLAIKPHRGGGMSRPSEAIWLINKLGKPKHLKMVYDFSHYAHRDMTVANTIRESLAHTGHIAVKDAVKKGDQIRFALPGSSETFDYAPLLKQFHAGGYRGDISCEVSSQVWRQSDYDPIAAAKICYRHIAQAFTKAGIARAS